jgi:hypothetical protein
MLKAASMDELHNTEERLDTTWVLVPAVVMSLGWGLRGYIGGGPFGAMIPGALVPLMLCRYLGYSVPAASVVVAFGALGIGYGGNMTYGQTLGLIRGSETFFWGLTGTTLKGGVWGLLGGAVLGLGFAARHIAWRHLILAFVCMLIGVIIGIHLINQPKLIYFSDPVNKPRDESWAGFLFGAIALLVYMRAFQPKFSWIPIRFAAYGTIGGGIGFGAGSLLLALQVHVVETWRWMPFWKYMEFTFGFLFGAALGLCAWHLRKRLEPLGAAATESVPAQSLTDEPKAGAITWMLDLLAAAAAVFVVFYSWHLFIEQLIPILRDLPATDIRRTTAQILVGFMGIGCVLMLLARRWQTVAWQAAISITIVAAAIDWQRDLLPRGKIDMPENYRQLFVLGAAAASILFVHTWQHRRSPRLMDLFLFTVCFLMGIGYLMGLGWADIWWGNLEAETAAGGRAAYLWQKLRGEIIVHSIFTTLFAISLWAAVRERRRSTPAKPVATQSS